MATMAHKPSKRKSDPCSYRPISFLCCLSKVFETIMTKRLLGWAENTDKLPTEQIQIKYGVPQGSPICPLLFLLYMFKLPKLLPNTRRSFFADDFMIYSESSITRSDLIQSNLQTSMDALTIFNSNYRIIPSCTKSVRVLLERKKRSMLKPRHL